MALPKYLTILGIFCIFTVIVISEAQHYGGKYSEFRKIPGDFCRVRQVNYFFILLNK